jgi:DNA-binding response OmpR family regulator
MRILVVEDNKKLAASLKRGLEGEGYAVDALHDGKEAENRLLMSHADYDLVILDLSLPSMDGIALCAELRTRAITLPILMLTARDAIDDKIVGLDSGADDYLVKPFAFEELLSRIRALSRRPRTAHMPELWVVWCFILRHKKSMPVNRK